MIEINVSKEMWAEWKENPVTKMFFRDIALKREQIKEEMAQGRYSEDYKAAVASCTILASLLNVEFVENEND